MLDFNSQTGNHQKISIIGYKAQVDAGQGHQKYNRNKRDADSLQTNDIKQPSITKIYVSLGQQLRQRPWTQSRTQSLEPRNGGEYVPSNGEGVEQRS